tara:strand:- start:2476 stop:3063 length:588 start_codon:yes stop_codon:yes gene_type:complete
MNLDDVKQDMENWITNYLDIPNEYYNGIKPCPFAKKAWFDNKVKVILGHKEEVLMELDDWDDKHQLVAVIFKDFEGLDDWCQSLNPELSKEDLYLMAHEPLDEDEYEEGDPTLTSESWGKVTDEVYGWVFIQRLSEVCKYSDILSKQDYYKDLPADFLAYVDSRRSYYEGFKEKGWNACAKEGKEKRNHRKNGWC